MPASESIYRVKLSLSFQQGLFMTIDHATQQDTQETIAPPARIRLWLGRGLWMACAAIILWSAFASLLPQNLRNVNPLYGVVVCASFVGRVLQFDFALAGFSIAFLASLLRRRLLSLVSTTVSIILIWPTLLSLFPKTSAPAPGHPIRVMTMNLLFNNHDDSAIVYQIRKADPDVIAMQEYSQWADETFPRELAEYRYRIVQPELDATGMAVYSRIPMSGQIQFPHNAMGTRTRIRAGLTIDGRQVVLYAIHPSSPHTYANIMRNRLQTADLLDAIRAQANSVIVAGDFNATETTVNLQSYDRLGFQSVQDLSGVGRGSTWPDVTLLKYLPRFRIDHILISRELTCGSSHVCGPTGSDHRPVVADIGFGASSLRGNESTAYDDANRSPLVRN
jgi:endonuclease/exonuclease/phosphatase (EEP) superfamily protein YafD